MPITDTLANRTGVRASGPIEGNRRPFGTRSPESLDEVVTLRDATERDHPVRWVVTHTTGGRTRICGLGGSPTTGRATRRGAQ
jgi:hypothetical protein